MGDKQLMWALKTGDLDEVMAKLVTVSGCSVGYGIFHLHVKVTSLVS